MTRSASPRIEWVDQARGWGMLLVIIGHAPTAPFLHKLIYSFHIPFFFALSGWLHNPLKTPTFGRLAKARWQTLIVPYFLYAAIGYMGVLAIHFASSTHPSDASLFKPLYGALLGWRNSSLFLGTLWFVTCLVSTEFVYFWMRRLGVTSTRTLLISLAVSSAFLAAMKLLPVARFWSLDLAMMATPFFAFGRWIRDNMDKNWYRLASKALPFLAIGWFAAAVFGGEVDMYTWSFGNPAWFFATAALGILCVFLVMPRLPRIGWIGYVGTHTLPILALHQWLVFPLAHRLQVIVLRGGLPDSSTGLNLVGIGYAVFCLLFLWPICLAFDKWAPVLVGGGGSRPAKA